MLSWKYKLFHKASFVSVGQIMGHGYLMLIPMPPAVPCLYSRTQPPVNSTYLTLWCWTPLVGCEQSSVKLGPKCYEFKIFLSNNSLWGIPKNVELGCWWFETPYGLRNHLSKYVWWFWKRMKTTHGGDYRPPYYFYILFIQLGDPGFVAIAITGAALQ